MKGGLLCLLIIAVAFIPCALCHAEVVTLQEGLSLATEKSRLLTVARQEEDILSSDTLIAKSRMLPDISVRMGQSALAFQPTAIFGTQTVPISDKGFFSYGLSVQQTLYDFRGNASRYQASRLALDARRLDTQRIKNLVALNYILIYFDLLEAERNIDVCHREVERLGSHLLQARNLYEGGVITVNDLLQAEVRISDARQRLLTAKSYRSVTASRLNSSMQRPLNSDLTVVDATPIPSEGLTAGMTADDAWATAEKMRPEVLIIEETLKAIGLEAESKRAELYPKFILRGGYDYTENRYQVHQGNWSVTLGMDLNLFSGGKTSAELSKLGFQKLKLLEQKLIVIDEIRLEVQRYLLDLRTASDRISVTSGAVRQAEENLRINRLKYEEGAGTATDVIDAVALLTMAETNYHKSVYDLRRAEGAVLYAIGKDISEVYK